eukprot:3919725-Prymnesium_polylepis.2
MRDAFVSQLLRGANRLYMLQKWGAIKPAHSGAHERRARRRQAWGTAAAAAATLATLAASDAMPPGVLNAAIAPLDPSPQASRSGDGTARSIGSCPSAGGSSTLCDGAASRTGPSPISRRGSRRRRRVPSTSASRPQQRTRPSRLQPPL